MLSKLTRVSIVATRSSEKEREKILLEGLGGNWKISYAQPPLYFGVHYWHSLRYEQNAERRVQQAAHMRHVHSCKTSQPSFSSPLLPESLMFFVFSTPAADIVAAVSRFIISRCGRQDFRDSSARWRGRGRVWSVESTSQTGSIVESHDRTILASLYQLWKINVIM